MVDRISDPAFEARSLTSARGWYVRVVWPHGGCEHIPGFTSEREAVRWIEQRAKAWLSERNTSAMRHTATFASAGFKSIRPRARREAWQSALKTMP
jgi:hypothetical protein